MTEKKIDKRTINGNNGTQRGKDLQVRKRKEGFYVHRPEVKAGLAHRLQQLLDYYECKANVHKELKVSYQTINEWIKRGRISWRGAEKAHRAYMRNGCKGFRASWLRYDLKFDGNGKCKDPNYRDLKYCEAFRLPKEHK